MHQLMKDNPAMVLDVLIARCAFERTGVALYDSAIAKIERSTEPHYRVVLDQLKHIRREEKEHEEWLEAQIRAFGGDPHAPSRTAQLEEQEGRGIKEVLIDGHEQLSHVLHALLAAEAADNAGWDLLVKLATDTGDADARREFGKRFVEEAKHLAFLREASHAAAEIEILGRKRELPHGLPRAVARRKTAIGMSLATVAGAIAASWGALRMGRRGLARLRRA